MLHLWDRFRFHSLKACPKAKSRPCLAAASTKNQNQRPLELEQAIAAVEDLIMPLAHQVQADTPLLLLAPALAPLAAASRGASPLTRVQIERYFQQLAAQAEGDPRATSLFKPTPEFAAALLIVREWMHHLGFEQLEFGVTSADHPTDLKPGRPARRRNPAPGPLPAPARCAAPYPVHPAPPRPGRSAPPADRWRRRRHSPAGRRCRAWSRG